VVNFYCLSRSLCRNSFCSKCSWLSLF